MDCLNMCSYRTKKNNRIWNLVQKLNLLTGSPPPPTRLLTETNKRREVNR